MEEKLNDRICNNIFIEFYSDRNINKCNNNDNSKIDYDYQKCLNEAKKIFRLLMKNDRIDTKDEYYIWMILLIIIKSLYFLNNIENSLEYIMISLKYSKSSWQMNEIMYYLIQYNIKMNKC